MKSKLSALVVLMLGLSLGNCDLLGVSLIDKSDFNIKDFKPSPKAEFIKGLKFSQEDVANELLGTGEDADLEIPLLGDALKAAGTPGGLIVLAKEVEYQGDYKWQLAALIKVDGDKLEYKQQKFPAASGKGNYGMFITTKKYSFVAGVAKDCEGNAKSNIYVLAGSGHNYLTKTDKNGKYGLPFEVDSDNGKSINIMATDEECGGGSAVSVPMNEPGNTEVPEKDGAEPDGTEVGACNGGEESITTAPEAPPMREGGDAREEPATPNACSDFAVAKVTTSGNSVIKEAAATTSSDTAAANCDGDKLILSTGATTAGNKGTLAALDFNPTGVKKIVVKYSVLSQEFPHYALGAFNDALGMGLIGSNLPGHLDSVGALQGGPPGDRERFMAWAYDGNPGSYTHPGAKSAITYVDASGANLETYGVTIGTSMDATTHSSVGGAKQFGGVTATAAGFQELEGIVNVPGNMTNGDVAVATFAIAIADVGDTAFDSAIVIHSYEFVKE